VTAVFADLEQIWTFAIENLLQIKIADLNKYRAVLIIPSIYHVKKLFFNFVLILILSKLFFSTLF